MKELRLVDANSLLEKQHSPLHTSPVVYVFDIEKEPSILAHPIVCHVCNRLVIHKSGYTYCPYCGNRLQEVL